MTADFVQIGPDGARSEGQLYVQRPGKLFFHYNPPAPLDIVADGRSLAVRDHNLGTQDLYFLQQSPLKFLLADHIDLAKDTTVKRVDIDENSAMIEIEDKATFGGKSEITLVFDPATFALKQWMVVDPQGFQTVVSLFDIDLVSKPDPIYSRSTRPHRSAPPGATEVFWGRGRWPRSRGQRPRLQIRAFLWASLRARFRDTSRAAKVSPSRDLRARRALFDRDLEHQFGAAAHRSRRPFPQGARARRAVPAGDQMPGRAIPAQAIQRLGYEHVALNGQKGYHGVAIVSRHAVRRREPRATSAARAIRATSP